MRVINLSNHPSTRWSSEQVEAAWNLLLPSCKRKDDHGEECYTVVTGIEDWPFPQVDPRFDESQLAGLVKRTLDELIEIHGENIAIHLMGESGFVVRAVTMLRVWQHETSDGIGITCFHSTTERVVEETMQPDGSTMKSATFKFVAFREY